MAVSRHQESRSGQSTTSSVGAEQSQILNRAREGTSIGVKVVVLQLCIIKNAATHNNRILMVNASINSEQRLSWLQRQRHMRL
jgi:hypothetical protein